MPEPYSAATPRLVIVLNAPSSTSAAIALRYAATAAAMDVAVELHAVSGSVSLLREGAVDAALLALIQQAGALGVLVFACPAAMADHQLSISQLIAEVSGVRGAAALLAAGLAPGARFMVF